MTERALTDRSWRNVGRSLRSPNFRKWTFGQGLSHVGSWMQQTAELWIVLSITGSGLALGIHSLLRFGPILLFGAFGGVLSDRLDRRRLLLATQSIHCLASVVLAVMSWIASPTLLLIYLMVGVQGLTNAVDSPLRRSFIRNLTSEADLSNAVSIDSTFSTIARTLGPALGGIVVAGFGPEWCFTINALSYGFVLYAVLSIDPTTLRPQAPVGRASRQLRAGLTYAWNSNTIRATLALSAVVSVFAWNWNTLLPGYAALSFSGDARLFGSMISTLSIGAFLGAITAARVARLTPKHLVGAGAVVAAALWCIAIATTLPLALGGIALLGASGTTFTISSQALLQLEVSDNMSGRIMSLFSVVFVGSKPIGGLLGGWIMDVSGPRMAFALGGAVVAVAISVRAILLSRTRRADSHKPA